MKNAKLVNYAVIGAGYWGKILSKKINEDNLSNLKAIVDNDDQNLKNAKKNNESDYYFKNYLDIPSKLIENIDIFVIATPPHTHYKILEDLAVFEKIYLITKPLCTSKDQLVNIEKLLDQFKIDIFVDETFIYSNNVAKIKEIISKESFGRLLYVSSNRSNFGRFQDKINVIWDLTPHDISIVSFISEKKPTEVESNSYNPVGFDLKDSYAHLTVHYEDNLNLFIQTSWISPIKNRTMIFGGSKQTLVYDHIDEDEPIKLFNQNLSYENIKDNNYFIEKIDLEYFEKNEPLAKEISTLSSYILYNSERPFADFKNSYENLLPLFNIDQ